MHIQKFLLYFFKISMYESSADFSDYFMPKCKSHKRFDIIMSTKFVFSKFPFWGGGLQSGSPPSFPLEAPMSSTLFGLRISWQKNKIRPSPIVDFVNYGLLIFINSILFLYFYNKKYFQVVYWHSNDFSRCRFADLVGLLVQILFWRESVWNNLPAVWVNFEHVKSLMTRSWPSWSRVTSAFLRSVFLIRGVVGKVHESCHVILRTSITTNNVC